MRLRLNHLAALFYCFAVLSAHSQPPTNHQHYVSIIRENVFKDYRGMFKPAEGVLKFPFITPGSDQYSNELWDWDSWLCNIALRQILLENGTDKDRAVALEHERGCVLNFLESTKENGWTPIVVSPGKQREDFVAGKNPFEHNMHKPCLAQHAAFLVKLNGGDAEWLREKFYPLQAFVNCYYNHYRHRDTGLYFWQNDEGVGVDNDPAVFYRPPGSSGSILLNCLMYKELQAMVYLAQRLNQEEVGRTFQKHADELLAALRDNCWDAKDGFYYSVDLNLMPYQRPTTGGQLHVGGPRDWDCLIQRLGSWSGFLALWSGVATPEEAKQIVERNFRDTNTFNAPYGVRTLSKMEKMYDLHASGNPSNWRGPIWLNANYLTFRGLVKYGYTEDARRLVEKTVQLIGKDFEKHGALHENYLPDSGEPVLNKGFQDWNYLVLNMIAWYEGKPFVEEF